MISVFILSWNNKKTIQKCAQAAFEDVKDMEHEFIFVDNGSDDGTVDLIGEWITGHLKDNFKFIRNSENKGISHGKNAGIDASCGEYILMLDGDVVAVPNSVKLMLAWLEENGKDALGMFPNKFSNTPDHAETYCNELIGFREFKCCCLYYGLFRRKIFDSGLRLSVDGEFGKPGYGWEDHDFFLRMKQKGIIQYVAHINSEKGKYFHDINSSIRAMGHDKYIETMRSRDKQFKETWEGKSGSGQGSDKPSGRSRRTRKKD